jgi:arylsulfate sulfotransferase
MAPYVTTSERFSQLVIMDFAGHIIVKKKVAGIVSDFRQWIINGRIRYSYAVYDPSIFLQNYSNGSVAYEVILDSALNEIGQVRLLPYGDIVTDNKKGIDHHDFIMLSDSHFITMTSYIKTVNNIPASLSPSPTVKLAVPILQEIEDGIVIWQWDASLYPEFYANSVKWNNYSNGKDVQDYMHVNGMTIDPADSDLIVSFHNTNQLVKINRKTGAIVWRFGGKNSDYSFSGEQVFLWQHNPEFADSGKTLMLFDNGDKDSRHFSRILEYNLDQQNRRVTGFRSYTIPDLFAENKGSVQVCDGNYFICGGSGNFILLADRRNGAVKFKMTYNHTSFRAYYASDITGITIDKNFKNSD